MITWVSADWVARHADAPEVCLLDPRRPMQYLQGHLKRAVNLPVVRAFDAHGKLLPAEALARWLGAAGVDEQRVVVIYDSPEGQNGAMLAWILDYLGHPDVRLLDIFYEGWVAQRREVFYRPVAAAISTFTPRLNPQIRITLEELRACPAAKLVDFRSRAEYAGERDLGGRPGHLPGAVNVVWRDLNGPNYAVLASAAKIERLLTAVGITHDDQIIAYCRSGPRAALGYLALTRCGYAVRLYDGSYAEWVHHGLPVEI